jgi:hypothetical protein
MDPMNAIASIGAGLIVFLIIALLGDIHGKTREINSKLGCKKCRRR